MATPPDNQHRDGLYLLMISIHGLVRGTDIELGRDADTGGQVKYVVEQARALAAHPRVGRVDLLTRQVHDRRVDASYAAAEEELGGNARLYRIRCGPRRYLHKESLWPHLDGFTDACLLHLKSIGRIPDVVHCHYADAGYVGSQLATLLGVPMIFTGHSLGRIKRQRLVENGRRPDSLEKKYHFVQRIEAEERALETAALVITSTHQEVEEQYAVYDHYQPDRMLVIPPGVDLDRFSPPEAGQTHPVAARIAPFLNEADKPLILALARPDERKNFPTLIEAYGGNPDLRASANLVLILGNRDDIRDLDRAPRMVLNEILLLIDRYDLYGSVAYPKHHEADDVPDFYRLAAAGGGVFVNPALTEPFGLTLIEAAASGLPMVATNDGGPSDIIKACRNGLLVDPTDAEAMGKAIAKVLADGDAWRQYAANGISGALANYSWSSHADRYVNVIEALRRRSRPAPRLIPQGRPRLLTVDRMLISDVDNTLTGSDGESLQRLFTRIEESRDRMAFAVATGRTIESALEVLEEIGAPEPEVLITSVGSEIYYRRPSTPDRSWERQIDYAWEPEAIKEAMAELPGLYPQKSKHQRRFKLSYDYDPAEAPSLREIRTHLRQRGLRLRPILSFQAYLDLLPIRASSGLAIRFLMLKWGFAADHLLAVGDSGNDEDMLRGETLGVVVGNYSPELEPLRKRPRIFFAKGHHAAGVLEGIDHYDFTGRIRLPEDELG